MNDIEQLLLPMLLVEKGLIRACNPVFTEQMGHHERDIVGRSLQDIIEITEQSPKTDCALDVYLSRVRQSHNGLLIFATVMNNYFYNVPVQLHCQVIEGDGLSFRICFRIIENKSVDPITSLPNGWAIASRSNYLLQKPEDLTKNFVLIFLMSIIFQRSIFVTALMRVMITCLK